MQLVLTYMYYLWCNGAGNYKKKKLVLYFVSYLFTAYNRQEIPPLFINKNWYIKLQGKIRMDAIDKSCICFFIAKNYILF